MPIRKLEVNRDDPLANPIGALPGQEQSTSLGPQKEALGQPVAFPSSPLRQANSVNRSMVDLMASRVREWGLESLANNLQLNLHLA